MKKQKILSLMFFLLFSVGAPEIKAQSLVIRLNDSTGNTSLLSTVQKLSFPDGNLLLDFKDGSAESFGLPTIQKLYFDLQTAVNENTTQKASGLAVYPNPANNDIALRNAPEGVISVFIYRVDGRLLLKTQISSDKETIDVSILQSGLYMLVANGVAVKFIKL